MARLGGPVAGGAGSLEKVTFAFHPPVDLDELYLGCIIFLKGRFAFSPSATRGRAVLRGDVDTGEQYRLAERIAERQQGVAAVADQVTVDGRAFSETDGAGTDTEESKATYHTVRRGDMLSQIARKYGAPVRQIRTPDDLSGPLHPGQEIRVR
jgi:FOG: LysM repeat